MEHRTEITMLERDEDRALAMLEALERTAGDAGPVLAMDVDAGTASYLLAVDADSAIEATDVAGRKFIEALTSYFEQAAVAHDIQIVDVHTTVVPVEELEDVGELQPA